MIVYGDRQRAANINELLDSIASSLHRAAGAAGPDRDEHLMRAFLDGAGLAQGLIDREFEQSGEDDLTPLHAAAMSLTQALALAQASGAPAGLEALASVAALAPDGCVKVKEPEGYAFYAVYPDAYRQAALARAWTEPPLVIGLRSIGVGLASAVAAACGARIALTLRPCGPPFRREVRVSASIRSLLSQHDGPFAIVDEGPGLSGSSFGCVADLLEDLGVGLERIVFLPSHCGDPGPQALPRHAGRWAVAQRCVKTLDDLLATGLMAELFADVVGAATQVEDLSGGRWLALQAKAPPANPGRERRKFRITTRTGVWLARFAGLGAIGEAKFLRAKALHTAGFTPRPYALRKGFLLERWEPGSSLASSPADRGNFLDHLARYLAFRARAFPASLAEGASPEVLCAMALHNAGVQPDPPRLGRPVHVDGKLHAWEWLRRADGGYLKLDALDHSCSHDVIGCQDIAWDIAGAAAEFRLSPDEADVLRQRVEEYGGPAVDPAAVSFFDICYAAFHLGVWTYAGESPGADRQRRFYRNRLDAILPRADR